MKARKVRTCPVAMPQRKRNFEQDRSRGNERALDGPETHYLSPSLRSRCLPKTCAEDAPSVSPTLTSSCTSHAQA